MTSTSQSFININNEKTFEGIFKAHYESLVFFALKYVNDEAVAEELVQEMFSNLWIKSETLFIKTSLKSYLYGAVRNACLNYLKHEKIKQAHAAYEMQHQSSVVNDDFLEFDELQDKINAAFDKMPEKCRQMFEMNRYEGKRYQEIADELDVSIKTVENQMGKALKILRNELKDYLILIFWLLVYGGI